MNDISVLLVFGAGVASIFSPCILPMIPAYIGYLAGSGDQSISNESHPSRWSTMLRSAAFIAGFSLVFIIMGASASMIGQLLLGYKYLLGKLGGVIIMLFGLQQLDILHIPFLYRDTRATVRVEEMDFGRAFILGIAFAAGWTPCVGPILSTILLYASTKATLGFGVFLLGVYSLGLAIPFLVIALGIDSIVTSIRKYGRFLEVTAKVSGVIMIIFGLMMLTDYSLF